MKTSVKWLWRLFLLGVVAFAVILFGANAGWFGVMPSIKDLKNPRSNSSTEVYAADATLMGKYYLVNRSPVEYKDISKFVVDALVATEDERFYEHSGIDGKAILRAVIMMGRDGGGSTITQQLALNLLMAEDDEYKREKNPFKRGMQKLREWIIAVKLEKNFTKEEIITYYLNTVPWGRNAFGIRNASKTFFAKEPDRLTIEEAALLVGMLKGNSMYDPINNPVRALERRNVVLGQMVKNEKLTQPEFDKAKQKEIKLDYRPVEESIGMAPYMREVIRDYMKKWCKEHKNADGEPYDIYRDGLRVYTTINPKMQLYAEEAVAKHVAYMQRILSSQYNFRNGTVWKKHEDILEKEMKRSDRWKHSKEDGMSDADIKASFLKPAKMKVFAWNSKRNKDTTMTPMDSIKYNLQVLQSAFMCMDPVTGEIKAWVGGIDFKTYKRDHANLNTVRQVGSIIKPFLYCLAVEEAGMGPETPAPDVPQFFPGFGRVPAENSTSGRTMALKDAIAYSKNGVAAYLMKQVTPRRFSEFLKNINIQHDVKPYPSMALGACELSLYEMLWGYTMFPGRGFTSRPLFITRIEDRNGNVLEAFVPEHKEVIGEVTAYTMAKMMEGCVNYGTGKAMRGYGIKAEMGAKTGTTNDNADAWFMGYTPQLLAGAWVGCEYNFLRFENTTFGQGGYAALPIWAYFFKRLYEDKSLGYSQDVKFDKPNIDESSLIYDYVNSGGSYHRPDAQAEDFGNGEASDYAAPIIDEGGGYEDLGGDQQNMDPAEQKVLDESKKAEEAKKTDEKGTPAKDTTKKPAAVMPKPVTTQPTPPKTDGQNPGAGISNLKTGTTTEEKKKKDN
jgi:penicillin-binding protein 1A